MTTSSNMSNSHNILVLFMTLLLLSPNTAKATITTCNEVYTDLYPCISYIMTGTGLSYNCCNGIQYLIASATTTTDRQLICSCIQSATSGTSFTSYNVRLANSLPGRCGVRVPYQFISTSDCDMIP